MKHSQSLDYQTYFPYLTLLAVQFCFGSLPVTGKMLMQNMPALAVVGFRVGITAFVLVGYKLFRGDIFLEKSKDYLKIFVLSLVGITLNQIFFIKGLSLTKASNAALLSVTIPIFTLIFSTVKGLEKLRTIKVVGIVLAAVGVLLLIKPNEASFSSTSLIGDFFIILNSLAYGIFVVYSKDVFTRNGAIKSATWIFAFAALICIPLGIYSLSSVDFYSFDKKVWFLTGYVAIVCTALPYLLVTWSIPRVPPSTVAVFVYMQPLIGFCLAVFTLGETFTIWTILAAFFIFSGVFLATRKRLNNVAAND